MYRQDFPLTDEEVIRRALKKVSEYAKRHPGDLFNVDECVEHTVESISRVWYTAKYGFMYAPSDDRQTIDELTCRIQAKLRTRARAKALGVLKSRTIQQFSVIRVQNQISEGLQSHGFDRHYLEWQKYRVKISIPLQSNKKLTFIVKYKDVPAKVQEILDNIASIRDIIAKSEMQISIR